MLWHTHVIIGAVAGIITAPTTGKEMIIATCISSVAALFPDIDAPYSKIGRKWPVASRAVNLFFGHRGVMHSLIGCVAVLFSFKAVLPVSMQYLSRYIGAGYISHILADMLNPAGVPLLWPIKKRFRVPLIRTGSFAEKMLFAVMAIFIFAKIEQIFAF